MEIELCAGALEEVADLLARDADDGGISGVGVGEVVAEDQPSWLADPPDFVGDTLPERLIQNRAKYDKERYQVEARVWIGQFVRASLPPVDGRIHLFCKSYAFGHEINTGKIARLRAIGEEALELHPGATADVQNRFVR